MQLEEGLPDFNDFWYKYSWDYLPLNCSKLFNFLPHPKYVCALPGENWTNEILLFYPMQCYYLIQIMHKNIFC